MVYFCRDKNFQDPPYNPSKLFLIRRIKSIKGASKREKRVLRELNIDGSVRIYYILFFM